MAIRVKIKTLIITNYSLIKLSNCSKLIVYKIYEEFMVNSWQFVLK